MKNKVTLLLVLMSLLSMAAEKGYWSWGWGTYGNGLVEDVARFDWSLLNFGNIYQDQRTVDRCNEILAINPKHKFVVRIWAGSYIGACKNNSSLATMWDFFYKAGVKEKVFEDATRLYKLIHDGITNPEALVGMTYFEELPGHISACPFKNKITGKIITWDMEPHMAGITAELGHEPDFSKTEDAMWWGKKYVEYINAVHKHMKSLNPRVKVLYWPATFYNCMDMTSKPIIETPGVLPFKFSQLLEEGNCDGIMGYPNTRKIWDAQCMNIVNKNKCFFFSQVSTPAFMRLSSFDDTVDMARTQSPYNLGSFVFSEPYHENAWNAISELRGRNGLVISDVKRWFCNKYNVGNDVAANLLKPEIIVDCDLAGKKAGDYARLAVVVRNPRDNSWFGGNEQLVDFRNLTIELRSLPDGFILPENANSEKRLSVPLLKGGQATEVLWWPQATGTADKIDPGKLVITVSAEHVPAVTWKASGITTKRTSIMKKSITSSGQQWLAFAPNAGRKASIGLEISPCKYNLAFPSIEINGRTVTYCDILSKEDRLQIFPGNRATLIHKPIFSEEVRNLKRKEDQPEKIFDSNYAVWTSPAFTAKAGDKYDFTITGRVSEGGTFLGYAYFVGPVNGKNETKQNAFWGMLDEKNKTATQSFTIPDFDPGASIKTTLVFYRYKQVGKLHIVSFDCKQQNKPIEEDVSAKVDGSLHIPGDTMLFFKYTDKNQPDFWVSQIADIKMLPPASLQEIKQQRKGGADF